MNEKHLVVGLIWALKRMGLVILAIAFVLFTLYLLLECFTAFLIEGVIVGIIWMTIHKAREEYWDQHRHYPTLEKLISELLYKGEQNETPSN